MRHFDVGDEYVGLVGEDSVKGFFAIARLGDD